MLTFKNLKAFNNNLIIESRAAYIQNETFLRLKEVQTVQSLVDKLCDDNTSS